jgi:predicted nucleic acid-binding protein
MTPVFADTYYFAALTNPADKGHAGAVDYARRALSPLVTTAWVITELADGLCKASTRPVFIRLRTLLQADPQVSIVPANQDLMDRGLALYEARLDKDWSLTNCISFVVMTEQAITEALTADRHFEQAGFVALLKDD